MAKCYVRNNNKIVEAPHNVPCGDDTDTRVQQCCAAGDTCGAQGFCHFTHQQAGIVSGYYLGGCTDANFSNRACPQHCTTFETQDVIYNTTNGLWACCVKDGTLDCSNPSDETFAAPNSVELFATSTLSTSVALSSSTSTTSVLTSATSTAATSATSAGPSPSATSIATNTGTPTSTIAVAAVIPVLGVFLIFALAFWWWRKRRSHAQPNTPRWSPGSRASHSQQHYESVGTIGKNKAIMYQSQEMWNEPEVYEMTGNEYRAELDGRVVGPDSRSSPTAGRRFRP